MIYYSSIMMLLLLLVQCQPSNNSSSNSKSKHMTSACIDQLYIPNSEGVGSFVLTYQVKNAKELCQLYQQNELKEVQLISPLKTDQLVIQQAIYQFDATTLEVMVIDNSVAHFNEIDRQKFITRLQQENKIRFLAKNGRDWVIQACLSD